MGDNTSNHTTNCRVAINRSFIVDKLVGQTEATAVVVAGDYVKIFTETLSSLFGIGGKNLESCTRIPDARYLIANTVLKELTDWKLLGEELGLEQYRLQEIQEDNRSYESRRRAMWRKWFDGEEKACWERIITALVNLDEQNKAAGLATSLGLDFSGTQKF